MDARQPTIGRSPVQVLRRSLALSLLPLAVAASTAASQDPGSTPRSTAPDTAAATAPAPRGRLIPLPVVYYTPETRWAGGAAALHSYRRGAGRPTVSTGSAVYTQNRQVAVELRTEAYLAGGRYGVAAEAGYSRFPDVFFGIGNRTLAADEEAYTTRGGRFEVDVRRELRPGLYAGATYELRRETVVEAEAGGRLAAGEVPGSSGGTASGAGVVVAWDTRDNVMAPASGRYHSVSVTIMGDPFGGDFRFTRYRLDARRYLPVVGRQVLAVQGVVRSTSGDVPFHLLPRLGGQDVLRGTLEGRYRDRQMVAAQAEYRVHVWRRIGAAGFVGAGQVAPRLADLALDALHPSIGAGVRFLLDPQEGTNLRVDFGYGRDQATGLYITIGEAF